MSSISNLPWLAQIRIASQLSPYELDKLGACSKALRNLCIDNSLWEPRNLKLDFIYSVTYLLHLGSHGALACHYTFRNIFAKTSKSRQTQVLYALLNLRTTPLAKNTFFRDICLNDNPQGKAWACYRIFIITLRKESLESLQRIVKTVLVYHFQEILFHLEQIGLLNNRSTILSDLIFYEQWHLISLLLKKAPQNLKVQFSGKALIEATRAGRLDVAMEFFQKAEMTEEDYCTAVVEAAGASRHDIIDLLLQKPIPDHCRGRAFMAATNAGCLNIMKALIKSGPIPETSYALALRPAILSGLLDFVNLLLENSTLTQADLGKAIFDAIGGGYPDIVEYLLSKGSISMEDRGNAAVKAVHAGKLVHTWTNSIGGSDDLVMVSRSQFELEHAKFIGMHSLAILEMLFQSGPISQEKQSEAAVTATQANRPDIVEFLKKAPISEKQNP